MAQRHFERNQEHWLAMLLIWNVTVQIYIITVDLSVVILPGFYTYYSLKNITCLMRVFTNQFYGFKSVLIENEPKLITNYKFILSIHLSRLSLTNGIMKWEKYWSIKLLISVFLSPKLFIYI